MISVIITNTIRPKRRRNWIWALFEGSSEASGASGGPLGRPRMASRRSSQACYHQYYYYCYELQ